MKQFRNPKGFVCVFMGGHERLNYLKRSIASSQPRYILITWLNDGNGLKNEILVVPEVPRGDLPLPPVWS